MPDLDHNRVKHHLAVQRNSAQDSLAVASALSEQLNDYLNLAFAHLNRLADEHQKVLNEKKVIPTDEELDKFSAAEKEDYFNGLKSEQLYLEAAIPGYKEWKQKNGPNSVPR
jgi:hypothetical protein